MADFVALWASRGSVLDELRGLLSEAESNRDQEHAAATLIQAAFRGSTTRSDFTLKHSAVTNMGRIARGYAARTRAAAARADRLAAEELAVRDYMATLIQKSYRAFHSRRYVHDFYARQAYIARLKVKSEKMRKDLDTHRAEQLHAQALKAEEAARKEFTTVTQNFHHLVSTRSIPGVFNPPYARTAEEIPSAFGVPVETHLRIGVKSLLRTRGLKPKGRAVPTYADTRATLRSQGVFGSEVDADRQASRAGKMNQLDERPFTGGGTARVLDPVANYTPSLSQGVPYQAQWETSKGMREKLNTEEMKAKRVSERPFYTAAPSNTLFEDMERTRSRERRDRGRRLMGSR